MSEPVKNKQVFIDDLNLSEFHKVIRGSLIPYVKDFETLQTAFSKTEDGYVFEIRKPSDRPFRMDALTTIDAYKQLKDFITLDGLREQMQAMAHQMGRLADKLDVQD